MSSRALQKEKALEIQEAIRDVLFNYWDPLGVNDVPEASNEYNAYVGGVYRLLASGSSADDIVEHLLLIEKEMMEMPGDDRDHLRLVAERLLALDVSL